MRKSIYNYETEYQGYHLIYNGLKSTCAILNNVEHHNFESYQCSEEKQMEYRRLCFYVDDDFDELDAIMYRSRVLTDLDKQQFYRIYTTTACNANCPYCYEQAMKPSVLTEGTADKICSFIESKMVERTRLGIEWFGGEPLLNDHIISYITDKLIPLCNERNIMLWSRMVSNGVLITPFIVDNMIQRWHLCQIQITLDGLKDTYEKTKRFRFSNAFERIIDNIALLLNANIRVIVRLNYDERNFNEILRLIDFLSERFPYHPKLKLYCAKIMRPDCDNSRVASAKTDILLLKQLLKRGYVNNLINTIHRRDNVCVAHMIHAFMILPNGMIGKCSQAMAKGDFVGSLISGIDDNKMVRWCTPRLPEQCLTCSILPICNGGCLYERFSKKPFCFNSREVIDFKLQTYLKMYIDAQC